MGPAAGVGRRAASGGEGRGAAAGERSGGGEMSGPVSARERIGWCGGEDEAGKKEKGKTRMTGGVIDYIWVC